MFIEISVLNANSADPDQTPQYAASDQGLHCLLMSLLWDARHKLVNTQSQKTYLWTCAPSEDSDQPAHSLSLVRIFTGRILDCQRCTVSSCEKYRLIRLWDAQADWSLPSAHLSEGTHCRS